jgi:diguanylate cyclase (GGDEF)-like protein
MRVEAAKARRTLRELFSKEKAARGFDIALARKAAMGGWIVGSVVGYGLMPFYPPTARLGASGWLITACLSVFTLLWMVVLLRKPERVTRDTLLVTAYLALLYVGFAQWLAGGLPAPYHELYPFMVCAAAAVHTPARFVGFLAVLMAVAIFPELGHASAPAIGDLVAELVLWSVAAFFVLGVMWRIRQDRADTLESEARANELARVDALTGLGNRRAFEETMDAEIARVRRSGAPLSLLVADLDRFKAINDVYGHLAGDSCLRQVADALRREVRGADVCFRWGGDEFVVVLADADAATAVEVAERLESLVAASCARPDESPLSVTCGHAVLLDWMSGHDLVAAADRTLLARKDRASAPPTS